MPAESVQATSVSSWWRPQALTVSRAVRWMPLWNIERAHWSTSTTTPVTTDIVQSAVRCTAAIRRAASSTAIVRSSVESSSAWRRSERTASAEG
jgi:hypothetical protein